MCAQEERHSTRACVCACVRVCECVCVCVCDGTCSSSSDQWSNSSGRLKLGLTASESAHVRNKDHERRREERRGEVVRHRSGSKSLSLYDMVVLTHHRQECVMSKDKDELNGDSSDSTRSMSGCKEQHSC